MTDAAATSSSHLKRMNCQSPSLKSMKFQNNVHLVATVSEMSSFDPTWGTCPWAGAVDSGPSCLWRHHVQDSPVSWQWDPALLRGRKNYYFSHWTHSGSCTGLSGVIARREGTDLPNFCNSSRSWTFFNQKDMSELSRGQLGSRRLCHFMLCPTEGWGWRMMRAQEGCVTFVPDTSLVSSYYQMPCVFPYINSALEGGNQAQWKSSY